MKGPPRDTAVLGMKPNNIADHSVLIAYSGMGISIVYVNIYSCRVPVLSDNLRYQSETEEATTYTEIPSSQVLSDYIGTLVIEFVATPMIMVWEQSDLGSATIPATGLTSLHPSSTVFTPRPTAATSEAVPSGSSHSSLSNGAVAAISTSAALSAIMLVAAYLFYRASRRRSANNNSQPEAGAGSTSNFSKPAVEVKAEMEDPVSAQELVKQSGAYRGKPELGNEVSETWDSNTGEMSATGLSITRDQALASPLPVNESGGTLARGQLAELE